MNWSVPPGDFVLFPWPVRASFAILVITVAYLAYRYRVRELKARTAELERAYERLRDLSRRLEAVREDERRRIARELHDEIGQELTAAKINLQLLKRPSTPAPKVASLTDTIGLLDRLIARVRGISLDLRPPLLDERGLRVALEGWLEAVRRRSGIQMRIELPAGLDRYPPDVEITVFRVVQEAVTNVLRHAAAKELAVSVGEEGSALVVVVSDDGAGFDVPAMRSRSEAGGHLGLAGMQERVELMGGTLEIASAPGKGTRVSMRLPAGVAAAVG
ncbi:MAG: sensor histidine kinase [Anaeromyxobacteraceae bacterium]